MSAIEKKHKVINTDLFGEVEDIFEEKGKSWTGITTKTNIFTISAEEKWYSIIYCI